MSAADPTSRGSFSPSPPSSITPPSGSSSPISPEDLITLQRSQSLSQVVMGSTSTDPSQRLTRQASVNYTTPASGRIDQAAHSVLHTDHRLENLDVPFGQMLHAVNPGPSSSSSPGPSVPVKPNLDALATAAEKLLLGGGGLTSSSVAGPSSSTTPHLGPDTVSNLERAVKAVDLLVSLASELELESSEKLNDVKTLIKDLKSAIIEERSARTEMITTLCEKLSPKELKNLGLSETAQGAKEYGGYKSTDDKYQAQGDLIRSFDKVFYNENSFKYLAKICAARTTLESNQEFKYKKLTGGLGYAITLNVVKQTPQGEKLIPIFVCKPVNAQPGGEDFHPFSEHLTDSDLKQMVEDEVKSLRDQIHNTVKGLLTIKIPENTPKIYELAFRALEEGYSKERFSGMTPEEFKGVLTGPLGYKGVVLEDDQPQRLLTAINTLFSCPVQKWNCSIDLTKKDNGSDEALLTKVRDEEKVQEEQKRGEEKKNAPYLVNPFRGALGIETNHVVASRRDLNERYPTIFERPLLSTLIQGLPVELRVPDGQKYDMRSATMVMEYCPNHGTVESANKGVMIYDIPEDQFHQEQIERRFIADAIFGFADHNYGNELIVDKQTVQTAEGLKEKVRLVSIDMGQANSIKVPDDEEMDRIGIIANPPFYYGFACMKDTTFYEQVAARIKDVNFQQLINDVVLYYKETGMPMTEDQIKLMIFRCEMLKALVAKGIGNPTPTQRNLLEQYNDIGGVIQGPGDESFDKMFSVQQSAPQQKASSKKSFMSKLGLGSSSKAKKTEIQGINYEIAGKNYIFTPQNITRP